MLFMRSLFVIIITQGIACLVIRQQRQCRCNDIQFTDTFQIQAINRTVFMLHLILLSTNALAL